MTYNEYLKTMTEEQNRSWLEYSEKTYLDEKAVKLLQSSSLPINIILFSGAWCPECALAGTILAKIDDLSSFVTLRIIDRDKSLSLYETFMPNGEKRVPVVLFTSEDYYLVTAWVERSAKKFELLFETLQNSKGKDKDVVFDRLRKVYDKNSELIIQTTTDELLAELTRTVGVINYSSRLNTTL
ncbi:MAG: thioredoxin family protein [Candidatus Kariarchaeaceae archaeon]|jgi:predicted glutamine amidotransferase